MNLLVMLIKARKWLSFVLFSDINDSILALGAQKMVLVTGNKHLVLVCFEHVLQLRATEGKKLSLFLK